MAVMELKGHPKAFAAMSVSKVNAMIDSKAAKASTKPKGPLKDLPPQPLKVQNAPKEVPRTAKAKGAANIPRVPPPVVKQAIEVETNKGGKVNQRA